MLLNRENLTRQYLDAHMKEHTLFPENVLETTSMDLLIDFARVGLGIAGVIRQFGADGAAKRFSHRAAAVFSYRSPGNRVSVPRRGGV